MKPCSNFTKTGNCSNTNCHFAHVVKLHASIDASSPDNSQQQSQSNSSSNYNNNNRNNYNKGPALHPVTSVAIWETQGVVKIFTGSQDGFWRLWNFTGGGFVKEFEHNMGGPVECLVVESNFLFCGFESISPSLPDITVGMVHAWNLANPTDPPLEFHMQSPLIPYAHAQGVTQLLVVEGHKVVSGSKDGSIKLWQFDTAANRFALAQTLHGHARSVTGLAVADGSVLWSSSTDGSIRIWDMAKMSGDQCQYAITMASGANPQQLQQQPQSPPQQAGPGHTNAVTSLTSFKSASGTFILSSSLDGDIKAWNGTTGQCVASEAHGEGVVTMCMGADASGKALLLIGLESGNIMVRSLEPTPKIQQAFAPLLVLSNHYTAAHTEAVKTVCQGPSGTFYSGGMDGKVLVFQFTGDMGL
jgi:WD40 repeat protein